LALRGFTLSPLLSDQESEGVLVVAGVDEVGAGCFAGPLYTACFAYELASGWCQEELPVRVCDSKKLSEIKRLESYEFLNQLEPAYRALEDVSVVEINKLNIYHARMEGLYRAFFQIWESDLSKKYKPSQVKVFIDGPVIPHAFKELHSQGLKLEAKSKGDNFYFPIAAASILAKTARDNHMRELSKQFPLYQWDSNVGYPTPAHKAAMKQYGFTSHHRDWELR
jgi:ribonuclease HII